MTISNQQQAEAWNDWEGKLWADEPERYDAMMEAFTAPLFTAADLHAHHLVLDVGCGTGRTTRLAARRAERGHVLGIDLSEPMLARARRDAADLTNIAFVQGDAQVHPFPQAHFDRIISRGGVMFFADQVAAFTHLRTALAPGGRLAFLCPRPGGPDSAYTRATAPLAPHLREASPAARGMGSLSDPTRTREVLAASGFKDIEITPVDADMDFGADARDAADFILRMGPTHHNLRTADPSTVADLRDRLERSLAEFETAQGVLIRGGVWIVTATP
ncbi:class I SAM-dependent methyltransferase [Saccharothrix variisporea]|uniref:Ubiquinone/menaquinone biosynthesis C-methylase UbiE n=1 Tax=Saccharothrix variisporea TaxID=543527 RepID=A0A495XM92_9PSEU|nr:class I SAM-dependent methyltransferase [Saccharothrix variisporea]RKT74739.1 ubiquinone/menaquinone biosynthesis C-methylase UbiE [Saccharothrix variisporea]